MPLLPVNDALEKILSHGQTISTEEVDIHNALGRITASDHHANLNQPPFHASAMDGYALNYSKKLTTHKNPTLKIIGQSQAGERFTGEVKKDEAVRIFTGAPIPEGADTVIMQEHVTKLDNGDIQLNQAPIQGANIRKLGNDFSQGDVIIQKGHQINNRHIGFLAAANIKYITVYKKPKIALLSTGDELVNVGESPNPDQIVNSNIHLLSALIQENGCDVLNLGIAKDEAKDLINKTQHLQDIDLFITIGGASVGERDIIQETLKPHGLSVDFWKVAIRPGKPLIFGNYNNIPMLGLPGNPASAYVCATVFMLPLIYKIQGRTHYHHTPIKAHISHALPANGIRTNYLRAQYHYSNDGKLVVQTTAKQDSAKLSTLSWANCLLIQPAESTALNPHDLVDILLL